VLDPFLGSGTTAVVARRLNRHYVGIDANQQYLDMAKSRLGSTLF
jgi:site-specific DNA-methyltransferase (adenine-specific)